MNAYYILLALVAFLSLPGVVYADPPTILMSAMWASQAMDLITTEVALRRGGVEANPLMRSAGVRWGAKAVTAVAMSVLVGHAWTTGHKKTAVWVTVANVAVFSTLGMRNLR